MEEDLKNNVNAEVEISKNQIAKEPKRKNKRIDVKAREEMCTKTLASYLEICAYTKNPHRGLNALYFHRNRARTSKESFPPMKNVNVYNALFNGFASKGDFSKIKEILQYVQEEQASLNVQSYVAIFECLGRMNASPRVITNFKERAYSEGITFDNIMNEGVFSFDQREQVLKAMRACDKDYQPVINLPSVQYCNHLVNHLNHEDQNNIGMKIQNEQIKKVENKVKGVFNKKVLNKLLQDQLEIEKVGFITVKSVESRSDPSPEILNYRKIFAEHLKMWEDAALTAFNRDLNTLSARRSPLNFEPYMRSIPTRDFIEIIIEEAKKIAQGSETYSPTVNQLYKELGQKVYGKYKVLKKQKSGVLDKVRVNVDFACRF